VIRALLAGAGFVDVAIDVKADGRDVVKGWLPGSGAENYVTSAYVTAVKPRHAHGFRDAVFAATAAGGDCCAPPAPAACCPPPAADACCPPPAPAFAVGAGKAKPAA